MKPPWESPLERWLEAGLIGEDAAAGIRAWERGRLGRTSLRWPAWLALALGGLLLGAGILLEQARQRLIAKAREPVTGDFIG
ncbi:MAG: hypothetical protein H0X69_09335 [Gemmatimonadales bacterium]|nr:hypothetical protein [Gemmatimonadales bacterium]